jgi:hypothetical protein
MIAELIKGSSHARALPGSYLYGTAPIGLTAQSGKGSDVTSPDHEKGPTVLPESSRLSKDFVVGCLNCVTADL